MSLPTAISSWIRPYEADRAAAAMIRELGGASSDWGTLIATAQSILSAFQDHEGSATELYDLEAVSPLIAAGRVLDSASRELSHLPADERSHLALQSSIGFGMAGNFPAARAVVDGLRFGLLSPALKVAIATAVPIRIPEIAGTLPADTPERRYLNLVSVFLSNGQGEEALGDGLRDCILNAEEPWESSLLRSARVCLKHLTELSAAKVLSRYNDQLPEGFLSRLLESIQVLLPTQYRAIKGHPLLEDDANVLIALPTGTGKTLLGELCLAKALGRANGVVCYVAPYVALGRQVYSSAERHFPRSVRLHQLFGSYRESDPIDAVHRQEVVVATPERFDALLRTQPEIVNHLRAVVFDEAHMVENGTRGIRVEGLLTRLRLGLGAEGRSRLVLLSAVLSNVGELADWIEIPNELVVRDDWRSTARRILFWSEDGSLKLYAGDDVLRSGSVSASTVLAERNQPWPRTGFYQARHYGDIKKQQGWSNENIAYLIEQEYRRFRQPVLCVAATKNETRQICRALAARLQPLEPLPDRLLQMIEIIDSKFPYLRSLRDGLSRGVAYHNSSLPHLIRQSIEEATDARALKAVVATTTLAEGVDLPFRVTVLGDWLFYGDDGVAPMSQLLYRNIAGRCGRPGQFTEGDVFIYDNPAGDASWTHPVRRKQLQQEIFFKSEPPTLGTAIRDSGTGRAIVGSQLLAAIKENPTADDLPDHFYAHTFASHLETDIRGKARTAISEAIQSIVTGDPPLAIASSPLALTDVGLAANQTGLSPLTVRKLIESLANIPEGESLSNAGALLLRRLADVPEQQNANLTKTVSNSRSRFVVKPNDFSNVIEGWIRGVPLDALFQSLPANQRSRRRPQLDLWLEGASDESQWEDVFENFVDFVHSVLENYLPWILRAAGVLAPHAQLTGEFPWNDWADQVEKGVSHPWAVWALDHGAPTERGAVVEIGRHLDQMGVALDQVTPGDAALMLSVFQSAIEGVESGSDLASSIGRIASWYQDRFG